MPIGNKEQKPSIEKEDGKILQMPEQESGKIKVEKEIKEVKPVKKEEKATKIETAKPGVKKHTSKEEKTEKQIEAILEEDLENTYFEMSDEKKKEFKKAGEETAWAITDLIYHKPKNVISKIIKLIRNWLKIIPGVNRFFLEQETKIKAEKIIDLKKNKK